MPGLYSATPEERAAAEEAVRIGLAQEGETPDPGPSLVDPTTVASVAPGEIANMADATPVEELDTLRQPAPEVAIPPPVPAQPQVPPIKAQNFPATAEGAKQALDVAHQSGLNAAAAIEGKAQGQREQRNALAAGHDDLAAEARAQATETDDLAKAHAAGQDAAHQLVVQAEQARKGMKFLDYWAPEEQRRAAGLEGHGTGNRILAAIFAGLGQFAAGPSGRNPALEVLNNQIEHDFRLQEKNLGAQEKFVQWAREGERDLLSRYNTERALLKIKQAHATEAVGEEIKAQIVRNGGTLEDAQRLIEKLGLAAKEDQLYFSGLKSLEQIEMMKALAKARAAMARPENLPMTPAMATLADMASDPNTTEKALRSFAADPANMIPIKTAELIIQRATGRQKATGEQQKEAQWGRQMLLAMDGMKKDKLDTFQPPEKAVQKWLSNQEQIEAARERNKSTLGQLANFGMRKQPFDALKIPANEYEGLTPREKQYFTYVRQIIEPPARANSGAAINAGEWTQFYNQWGPQAGEAGRNAMRLRANDMVVAGGVGTARLQRADVERGSETPGSVSAPPATRSRSTPPKPTKADLDIADQILGGQL